MAQWPSRVKKKSLGSIQQKHSFDQISNYHFRHNFHVIVRQIFDTGHNITSRNKLRHIPILFKQRENRKCFMVTTSPNTFLWRDFFPPTSGR